MLPSYFVLVRHVNAHFLCRRIHVIDVIDDIDASPSPRSYYEANQGCCVSDRVVILTVSNQ